MGVKAGAPIRTRGVCQLRLRLVIPLLLLPLVGCSQSDRREIQHQPPTPRAPTTTIRLEPLDPVDRSRLELVETDGYARSSVRGLWRVAAVDSDDQTITVTVANGACLYLTHMTVEKITDAEIGLAAWNDDWQPVKENYGCTLELRYVRNRFRLPEAIGGRVLGGQCVPGDATVAERQCPDDFFLTPPTTALR